MTPARPSALLAALALSALSGCALLSKSDPITPHYFSAEASAGADSTSTALADAAPQPARRLRLGHVSESSALRERILYRNARGELGFYEDRRWTERPENYLRRALSRALFEQRGFTRAVSGPAPTLEAELITFEEARDGRSRARVRIAFTLDDERDTLLEHTFSVEIPVASEADHDHGAALAHAMQLALSRAVSLVADAVDAAWPRLEAARSGPSAEVEDPG